MKRYILCILFFVSGFSVGAHRLNEYLQATTISLTKDSVSLHLHLAAGTDIAQNVLKVIDHNSDGVISDAEQQIYARLIIRNLILSVNARGQQLSLISWKFPRAADVLRGAGDIELIISARLKSSKSVQHLTLAYKENQANHVYLVNCLVPADSTIQIISQTRNADQSVYQLDFSTNQTQLADVSAQNKQLEKGSLLALIETYFTHGFWHILTGYDHLLFLCALVLGAAGLWDLVKILTAFTIAHSLTLTLAVLGYVHIPAQIVEPVIAASIVFAAVQNIGWRNYASGQSRLVIAFLFGLFHGLGFAGGLMQLMHVMSASLMIYAILGFSLGVEIGNQIILLLLYLILQAVEKVKTRPQDSQRAMIFGRYASGVVAIAGLYYLYTSIL